MAKNVNNPKEEKVETVGEAVSRTEVFSRKTAG